MAEPVIPAKAGIQRRLQEQGVHFDRGEKSGEMAREEKDFSSLRSSK